MHLHGGSGTAFNTEQSVRRACCRPINLLYPSRHPLCNKSWWGLTQDYPGCKQGDGEFTCNVTAWLVLAFIKLCHFNFTWYSKSNSRCPGWQSVRCSNLIQWAVPWLRWLVAGLSPRRTGFTSGSIHVGFVVDKVTLGQVFLRVLRLSPVSIVPPSLSKLISSGECVIC
jgi:hypothetical protein